MKNKSGDSWQLKHQRLRKQSGSSPKQGDGKASNTLSSCTLVLWNRTCEGASAASLDWSAPLSERPKPESGTKVLGFLRFRHKTRHKWCTSDTCVLEGQIPHLEQMRQMSRTLVSHIRISIECFLNCLRATPISVPSAGSKSRMILYLSINHRDVLPTQQTMQWHGGNQPVK